MRDTSALPTMTVEEYFRFEERSPIKHEYVAGEVWAERTGKDFAEFPRTGSNIGQEPAGEPWSEEGDDLRRRFPKLWKKFGGG